MLRFFAARFWTIMHSGRAIDGAKARRGVRLSTAISLVPPKVTGATVLILLNSFAKPKIRYRREVCSQREEGPLQTVFQIDLIVRSKTSVNVTDARVSYGQNMSRDSASHTLMGMSRIRISTGSGSLVDI